MTVTKSTLVKILQYLLLLAIVGTVAFIFINSMLPPAQSAEQSDTVKDIIVEILPDDSRAESFVEQYIRKIAHFTEYGLLGLECAVYLMLFTGRRVKTLSLAMLTPFFVGFTDETIQHFSKRGPMIEDVWIDVGGFVLFYLLALAALYLIFLAVKAIKAKINSENNVKEGENG